MSALTRRDCLVLLAAGASLPCVPAFAGAHEQDWDWLLGSWDVWHRRLKDRLVGSKEWQEFTGRSAFWHTLGGLGNIDDNSLALPAGDYRGLSVRAFDPKAGSWAIWWLDGRNPEHIDPPVRGGFHGDEGEFIGTDTHKGTPVTVRFRWHEVRGKRPWWDQAFSTDGGKTWEINWRNYFTRTMVTATAQPRLAGDPPEARAWDFLVGKWKVRNRRLRSRFTNSKDWDEFDSTLSNWQVLGGRGNIGDNWFAGPKQPYRGMSLRAYNVEKQEWLSWWLDGRDPANIGTPVRGKFIAGSGTLIGDDTFNGKPIKVRSQWTRTDTDSPRWNRRHLSMMARPGKRTGWRTLRAPREWRRAVALFGLSVATQAADPRFETSAPALFAPDVASTQFSDIRLTLSADGDTALWFSRDRPGGPGGYDIWMSKRSGADWSAPTPVAFNSPQRDFDPAFSADGHFVYFCSDRPGGLGGDDIYRVAVTSSGFGRPEALDSSVNSPANEWAPMLSRENELLFSSNGRGGAGRMDLFIAQRRGGVFATAAPVTGALNSAADEFDATFLEDGKAILFSRAANLETDTVWLYIAFRDAKTYGAATKLSESLNVSDKSSYAPMIDWSQPDRFTFTRAGELYLTRFRMKSP